jgi:hypothetical protein
VDARRFLTDVWTIDILADGEREFVREFLEELERNQPPEYRRVVALLLAVASNGPPRNIQKYRAISGVSGQLAELKGHQARIMCFFDGPRRIVLTHGFLKKRAREPDEIQRAVRLRDAYQLAQAAKRRGRNR